MELKCISICAAVAALTANLLAQATTTIPAGYDSTEGRGALSIPLLYSSSRIQTGYGPKAIPWSTTRTIKELWVRADRVSSLTTSFSSMLHVRISSKGCDPATRSSVFAKNHGSDLKTFMSKTTYKFQSFSKGTTFPAAWTIRLKGDAPFVATTPSLVVDWASYTAGNLDERHFSYYLDSASFKGTTSGFIGTSINFGSACNPTNFLNRSQDLNAGDVFFSEGFTYNKGDFVLAWLGAINIAVPISGLTGCTLYTAPVIVHPIIAKTNQFSAYGYVKFAWGTVPASMVSKRVYSQLAALDSTFQKMRFSAGNSIQFGNYKVVYSRLLSYRYGWAALTGKFDPDRDDAHGGGVGAGMIYDLR